MIVSFHHLFFLFMPSFPLPASNDGYGPNLNAILISYLCVSCQMPFIFSIIPHHATVFGLLSVTAKDRCAPVFVLLTDLSWGNFVPSITMYHHQILNVSFNYALGC
jgi:hypothetical protein